MYRDTSVGVSPYAPMSRRVTDGIAFLDKHKPGWRKLVHKPLVMGDSVNGILPQVYGKVYRQACLEAFGPHEGDDSSDENNAFVRARNLGFDIDSYRRETFVHLQQEWVSQAHILL